MAKQKGPVTFRGKLGDEIFTDGKYGKQVRRVGKITNEQKKAKAELPQIRRTAVLNKLASSIATGVEYYAGALKSGQFYAKLLSDFREEKSDHRILLLDQIKNSEVHPKYPFQKISPIPGINLAISKTNYTAEVEINEPAYKFGSANCFYLQFILFVWNKDDDNCRHMAESTPWIRMTDKTAKYTTVKFKRTVKDTEHLLACRCVMGVNEVEVGWTSTGMRFPAAGTVTKEGQQLLEEKKAAIEAARKHVTVREAVKEKPRLKLREKK